jgi:hypothetical protein
MNISTFLLIVSMIAFCHLLLSVNRLASQDLFLKRITYWCLVLIMGSIMGVLIWKVIETITVGRW